MTASRVLLAALWLALAGPAAAQTLVVGTATQTTSIDPHFQLAFTNIAPLRHVFDPLFAQDARQQLHPALAVEWTAVAPTTWRIKLRAGVRFHDGTPFTAEDVAFTLARAPNVPNSPASYALYTRAIEAVTVVDALTVEIRTRAPHPTLPMELSTIGIVSRRAAAQATTADFNAGRAAIGTGPFRFEAWTPGERLVLARNEDYWGARPDWARVEFRRIPNESARVVALLAGDADIVEAVPPNAVARIRERADMALASTTANRVILLAVNHAREPIAQARSASGEALPDNPLRDLRVRQAISAAIDRPGLVERVMLGEAAPAGQVLPATYASAHPGLAPDAFDIERARRLLAQAGHALGLTITLIAPNDRYVNDEQVAQAISQMLARAGIRVQLEALPSAIVLQRGNRREFGLMMWGISSETGETLASLHSLLGSEQSAGGRGNGNRGYYADAELDALIAQASAAMDPDARTALGRAAAERALGALGFIPLYFPTNTWAMRRALTYAPRADGYTLAMDVRAR